MVYDSNARVLEEKVRVGRQFSLMPRRGRGLIMLVCPTARQANIPLSITSVFSVMGHGDALPHRVIPITQSEVSPRNQEGWE